MKKLITVTSVALAALCSVPTQAAQTKASTKIVFAPNSYCGNFSGDVYNGKLFRVWLQPNQELVVRNVGRAQTNIAYVEGPAGRLDSDDYDSSSTYYTEDKGNHYIKVYGNTYYSKIEFCAY